MPHSRLRDRESDVRLLSASGDRGERARGRPTSSKGRGRQVGPPLPGMIPSPAVLPTDHPARRARGALGRRECQQGRAAAVRGSHWGLEGGTQGFQEGKGGDAGSGMSTPGGARGATPGLPSPPPPSPPDPPRVPDARLLSPSRLLYAGVQHSDLPSPHGGNSSCRSAAGSIGPS